MGNANSQVNFRKAVIELTSKKKVVEPGNDSFWEQFFAPENVSSAQDVFSLIPAAEIRSLREDAPNNLATLCYKAVQRLMKACESGCQSSKEQQKVINCVRLLTRILPYIFEDPDWRGYFWSVLPADSPSSQGDDSDVPLAKALVGALADLLFCPDFTVSQVKKGPETPEDLSSIDSCLYIWEAGVGFAQKNPDNPQHDANRTEILKLLLTCFSEVIYVSPDADGSAFRNRWIQTFTSAENRHVLPLFTSLLNSVCAYNPSGSLPYNHLLWSDTREPLVQVALQLLVVCLDHDHSPDPAVEVEPGYHENFFINYLSRIHREEDFEFILKGFTRLLNNPLTQTYLPNSAKKIAFHQELLVFFWKCCEYNKKFMYYVLKSSDVLEILVPILYYLNEARNDQSRVGLIHMGVFILLLLSGERNFGVRLNKPYALRVPMDIPVFTGTHADLLLIVFHKLITTGNQRLQSLFDCLLTIVVNVSPYLKSLSMVAANKLVHLLEAFSTPWFLYSSPANHHLVFFILEVFNNIIQYQFDGNANLVYTIIRKRQAFYQLANLPTEAAAISKCLSGRKGKRGGESLPPLPPTSPTTPASPDPPIQEGAKEPEEARPGTMKATLAATPQVGMMTERSEAHLQKSPSEEEEVAKARLNGDGAEGADLGSSVQSEDAWTPTSDWVQGWKSKLPLQTIMRLLQVLVPQVEKICIDKGLTDESEILRFLQHGTLVGLLPVPHPILIRKYQANLGTNHWFRTYIWGLIYLRNTDPPIWYDTDVKLFEIQRV